MARPNGPMNGRGCWVSQELDPTTKRTGGRAERDDRSRQAVSDTIAAILAAHRAGASPEATIASCYARIRAHDDPAVFISLRDEADALAEAKALAAQGHRDRPLYSVPVAVKDNIDVKGL